MGECFASPDSIEPAGDAVVPAERARPKDPDSKPFETAVCAMAAAFGMGRARAEVIDE